MNFRIALLPPPLRDTSRVRALLRLYRRCRADDTPELRSRRLLRQWLSAEQQEQFDRFGCFEVIGCSTGKRYRIYYGTSCNIHELDAAGGPKRGLCFVPHGQLVSGDVVLAQKIALETNELAALDVAKEFPPTSFRGYPGWPC
jgi:hypothetical protein